ncbi:hypothetical protein GUJ93_ZPchr1073g33334 [Zizania palustris]|uniref:Uncharacterized protein n=1 Tax=Zizania palustris TaxID=103762 RepID=A0A8J5RP60_ZIZPA|nr:hypothetical protein GUJ93_ZPchr1073g33334 [Zizania palustris]
MRWSPVFRPGCMPRSATPAAACRARTHLRAPPPSAPARTPTHRERCSPFVVPQALVPRVRRLGCMPRSAKSAAACRAAAPASATDGHA